MRMSRFNVEVEMARLLCCSDWSFHASAHAYGCSSVPMTPLEPEPELLDEGCTRCDDESVTS